MADTPTPRMQPHRNFAIRYINPITRRFAGWLPGFAMLTYRGRTSGRTYSIPINVFRRGDYYIFALTYGSDAQWVKNILASGGAEIRHLGRQIRLMAPELIIDPSAKLIPVPVRWFLRSFARVTEFVRMRTTDVGAQTRV